MPDNASEKFIHDKAQENSRMDEIIEKLESSSKTKRGSSIAASSDVTIDSGDLTPKEMMQISDEFDVDQPAETEEESTTYMLDDDDVVEALDESYDTITGVLKSQSWDSLENSPLYDDDFVGHLENLQQHLSEQVSENEQTVLSAPESEADELRYEFEGRDYVVSVPESEAYSPEEDIQETLEALTASETEDTGARLKLLDMYANGADIQEAATELESNFENIYEADDELREVGLVENEELTEKGLHVYGTVVAQYEELEG